MVHQTRPPAQRKLEKLNTSYTYSYNGSTTKPFLRLRQTKPPNTGPLLVGQLCLHVEQTVGVRYRLVGVLRCIRGVARVPNSWGDYQKVTSRWRAAQGIRDKGGLIDIWNPGATPLPNNVLSNRNFWRDYQPNGREQYGLYSTLRLQLTDPLKLVIGTHAQRYKFKQTYSMLNSDGSGVWAEQDSVADREPTKVVPYGGLIYALNDEWSTYISYAEVFKPQAQEVERAEGITNLN